jgi:hypothetical protein
MDRFVKVPVVIYPHDEEYYPGQYIREYHAKLKGDKWGVLGKGIAHTEDEAFANLLEKLHYEEAKSLPNDLHDMFCRILDVISKCPIVDEGNEQLDSYAHTLVEIEHMVCDLLNREAE